MALPCMACKCQMFLVKCLKDPSDKFNHQVSHNSACPGHQVLGNWESISTISLPQDISTSIESSFCGTLSPRLILPRFLLYDQTSCKILFVGSFTYIAFYSWFPVLFTSSVPALHALNFLINKYYIIGFLITIGFTNWQATWSEYGAG